jgi:hypothetical protein
VKHVSHMQVFLLYYWFKHVVGIGGHFLLVQHFISGNNRDIHKFTLSLGLLSPPNPSFSDIRKVMKFY